MSYDELPDEYYEDQFESRMNGKMRRYGHGDPDAPCDPMYAPEEEGDE